MAYDVLNDRELIDKYLAGETAAFSELVKRHQNPIYSLAFRVVGRAEEAEDLTQEIFIRLLDKVSMWRGEAKVSTWLYRLALNHCRDHLRRRRPETVEVNESLPSTGPDPAKGAETREVRQFIEAAMMELPIDFRAVIYLRDYAGFSYNEIASILEIELGTVKSRLARARSSLAGALGALRSASRSDREQIDTPGHLRG